MAVCSPFSHFTSLTNAWRSLAGQPYFSYVHACAYDKWAGGICTEKYSIFPCGFPRPLVICACVHIGKIRLARETMLGASWVHYDVVCIDALSSNKWSFALIAEQTNRQCFAFLFHVLCVAHVGTLPQHVLPWP